MTRLNIVERVPPSKNLKRFEDKFPNDIVFANDDFKRKSSLPLFCSIHNGRSFEDALPNVREESKYELNAEKKLEEKLKRRHSWTLGMKNAKWTYLPTRKLSTESAFSNSASSITGAIEECSSDDEMLEEEDVEENVKDYMHCINCNRKNNNASVHSDNNEQKMNYCYNCRQKVSKLDLVRTPLFTNSKNTTWLLKNSNSTSTVTKKKLSNSCDLPVISEVTASEEKNLIARNNNTNNELNANIANRKSKKHRKLAMSISDGDIAKYIYKC